MSKLETMQRQADRLAAKTGISHPVTVRWVSAPCRLNRYTAAHAHVSQRDPNFGAICVKRGAKDLRGLMAHEVAHFLPGGKGGHREGFTRALARAGDRHAIAAMREYDIAVKGKRHHHDWIRGSEQSRRATTRGLIVTYDARCRLCGKQVPA